MKIAKTSVRKRLKISASNRSKSHYGFFYDPHPTYFTSIDMADVVGGGGFFAFVGRVSKFIHLEMPERTPIDGRRVKNEK